MAGLSGGPGPPQEPLRVASEQKTCLSPKKLQGFQEPSVHRDKGNIFLHRGVSRCCDRTEQGTTGHQVGSQLMWGTGVKAALTGGGGPLGSAQADLGTLERSEQALEESREHGSSHNF